uniref:Uncharacterized protein n=1 Tax=Kalanchoe fedtschenkoi TaxID=63787 RepID=A0A7N0TY93_KALFE
MENFRSKSCRDGATAMEMRSYSQKPSGMQELRSYSTSYAKSLPLPPVQEQEREQQRAGSEAKMKKGKAGFGSTKSWVFSDPELQRRKRVASYKGYTLEGKVKGSFRKSFRWIKDSYSHVVHGWK